MKENNQDFCTLNMPMEQKILNATSNVMNDYMIRHSKMWFQRIDVILPEGMDQKIISTFNQRFIECEKNHGFGPAYVMVREVSNQGRTHYHMALFLNGQKTRSSEQHFDNARRILNNVAPGGHVDYCNDGHRNGIMIRCNNPDHEDLSEVQRQLSYLAKTHQKAGVEGKTFFTSQIKKH